MFFDIQVNSIRNKAAVFLRIMYTSSNTARQILSVSKLNRLAGTLLKSEIGLVWLSAEVSNFVSAASGHWYFTLKDNKAQVRAAMFRNANQMVRQRPKEGDKILVRASVGLYEPRGDYQLVVEHMESDGEGRLKAAFDALKLKLHQEGLFSAQRKQALPDTINTIGIITSASGAALHDALTVLKRRSPTTQVIIYPSMVQGDAAPAQLIQALRLANSRREVDVILLTRGGGSLEDLWCFNDETLAREIAASELPVVSAVGHEVDVTIADFVADLRAPTPSAGAELLSQDQLALQQQTMQLQQRLLRAWQGLTRHARQHLQMQQQALRSVHPVNRIQQQSQSLDKMQMALIHAMRAKLNTAQMAQDRQTRRLDRQDPQRQLHEYQQTLQNLISRNTRGMQRYLQQRSQQLASQAQLLQSVSPLSTLSRGYSITFKDDQPVTSTNQLKQGDSITSVVKNGKIVSIVQSLQADTK